MSNETLDADLDLNSVAVIGASIRMPGASTLEQFWANLANGVESITQLTDEQLHEAGIDAELLRDPAYVRAGARADGLEDFDAPFFDITPREAEITDPQHRVLLECAHEALEMAGYPPHSYPGVIALYAGVGLNTYLLHNLMPREDLIRTLGMHQLLLGNDKCYAVSRIGYKLNLRGACICVDTACSTGLVTVAMAYKSLIAYECDIALAGGAKVNAADAGYFHEPGGINSPDGHCRTFDANARGTVFGSGAGIVAMKRLEDARRDRDTILAIIRSGAVNSDGSAKVGFTAPSVTRQRDVITQALAFSRIPASSISYVEAHGTGTQLGDPVELAALSEAFERSGAQRQSCAIGSVKPNIGHLETAAGIAGLVKVIQALRERQLPPSLNYRQGNAAIGFERTPFYVNTHLQPWHSATGLRRACVSSFGLGGVNAHVILEEEPPRPSIKSVQPRLLIFSARSPESLRAAQVRLAEHLQAHPEIDLRDVAFTLAVGRQHHPHRSYVVGANVQEAVDALMSPARKLSDEGATAAAPIAFLIPGQGVQSAGMALPLYRTFAAFREVVNEACDHVRNECGLDVRAALGIAKEEASRQDLDQTLYAQPAIFITAYATATLLSRWGIRPSLLVGHSLGEYVAACLAGTWSLPDALKLVVERARLMQAQPSGTMLAATLSHTDIKHLLDTQPQLTCDVAAVNGPASSVVAGTAEMIDRTADWLQNRGVTTHRLRTSHAFHSRMMEPVSKAVGFHFARVKSSPPKIPFTSCIDGACIAAERAQSPEYWATQLRQPVRFDLAIRQGVEQGVKLMLDIGPGTTAASLAMANTAGSGVRIVSCADKSNRSELDVGSFLAAIGELWRSGVNVDWQAVYADQQCGRVPLPTYPFQKKRCWIEPKRAVRSSATPASTSVETPPLETKLRPVESVDDDGPSNETEAMLVRLWRELLGVEHISIHDSFFALGGQSLLATRLLARIRESTGVELPLQTLFESPTVAGVALALFQLQARAQDPDVLEALLAEIESEQSSRQMSTGA